MSWRRKQGTYHLSRLGPGDVEFHISILLPVSKQERKLEEKSIVCVAESRQGLGTRVSVQTTLEGLAGLDEVLPVFEVVGVGFL